MQYFHSGSSNLEQTIPSPISHQTWICSLREPVGALCRWVLSCWCEQTVKERRTVRFLWAAPHHRPHQSPCAARPWQTHRGRWGTQRSFLTQRAGKNYWGFETWAVRDTCETQVRSLRRPQGSALPEVLQKGHGHGTRTALITQLYQKPGKVSDC